MADKAENGFFLFLEEAIEIGFDLISQLPAHDFDIAGGIIFVAGGIEKHGCGQRPKQLSVDDQHIKSAGLEAMHQHYQHIALIVVLKLGTMQIS